MCSLDNDGWDCNEHNRTWFLLLRNHSYTGRNFYYGIREHAMGSILNGITYFGLHRCSGSTFLVFADYMRAPMRVAALSELPVNYILTHDSIGVGEVSRSEEGARGVG